jgi:hypothetical protein
LPGEKMSTLCPLPDTDTPFNDACGTTLLFPPQSSNAWKHLPPTLLAVMGCGHINLPVGISLISLKYAEYAWRY